MNAAVRLRPEAEADVAQARAWYDERARGLGLEFVRAFEAALAGIERFPEAHARVHGETRRAMLRKFPYGVFYIIENEWITVLACLHTARDPAGWQERT